MDANGATGQVTDSGSNAITCGEIGTALLSTAQICTCWGNGKRFFAIGESNVFVKMLVPTSRRSASCTHGLGISKLIRCGSTTKPRLSSSVLLAFCANREQGLLLLCELTHAQINKSNISK